MTRKRVPNGTCVLFCAGDVRKSEQNCSQVCDVAPVRFVSVAPRPRGLFGTERFQGGPLPKFMVMGRSVKHCREGRRLAEAALVDRGITVLPSPTSRTLPPSFGGKYCRQFPPKNPQTQSGVSPHGTPPPPSRG